MESNIAKLLTEVDDIYVTETIPQKICDEVYQRRNLHAFSKIAVASLAIILSLLIGMANPVWAQNLPFIGKIFEFIQEKIDFSGIYSYYATEIGEATISNGVKITLSECYCDGLNLYIAYEIVSDKPFEEYTEKDYMKKQIDYSANLYISFEGKKIALDDTGVSGLEGEFVNKNTFIGVETLSLNGKAFPEKFDLNILINNIQLLLPYPDNEFEIHGTWEFEIPMESNTEDCQVLDVELEVEKHSIDRVVISPIMITVYSSYPDIYSGTVDYDLVAFSDIWEGNAAIQGIYDATSGITRIPRYRVKSQLELYVIDSSTIDAIGIERYSRKEISEHAILYTKIDLQ